MPNPVKERIDNRWMLGSSGAAEAIVLDVEFDLQRIKLGRDRITMHLRINSLLLSGPLNFSVVFICARAQ